MEKTVVPVKNNNHKKVLLTGGTGLLGHGLAACCRSNYQVYSLGLRSHRNHSPWSNQLRLDITSKACVEKIFTRHSFNAVVHAAGIASVDYVKEKYAESLESNIVGTLNISSACRKRSIPMVYISSNAVFDGSSPPYSEADRPNPVNEYGELKLECERLIQKTLEKYLIVRPILMYGWNSKSGRANPVTWLLQKLRNGEPVNLVNDIRENPLYNIEAGRCIWKALEMRMQGILHLAGATEVSRYQLALQVAEVFGQNPGLIRPVSSSYFPNLAVRPPNTTFDTSRMQKELGVRPLPLVEGLMAMKHAEPNS